MGTEDLVMKRIERFEDLIAWQKARELTKGIYQATREPPFCKDFDLSGQIQRVSFPLCRILPKVSSADAEVSSINSFLRQKPLARRSVRYFMLLTILAIWTNLNSINF